MNNIKYHNNVNKIINFLEINVDKKLVFSDLCYVSSVGETNLKKYFKLQTGRTIMNYFKCLKIRKALILIDVGDLSFTQISSILGYDSIHYFSRQFKKIIGVSPSEYTTLSENSKEHIKNNLPHFVFIYS